MLYKMEYPTLEEMLKENEQIYVQREFKELHKEISYFDLDSLMTGLDNLKKPIELRPVMNFDKVQEAKLRLFS